jgi:DNA modification methylase
MNIIVNKTTTAIACINTNRNYIGFELDNTYFELANQRIEEHKRKINI